MEEKNIKIPFDAPLSKHDTENQTFGCRQHNPDICGNNGIEKICAFANKECICYKPSRLWKKQYSRLVSGKSNDAK